MPRTLEDFTVDNTLTVQGDDKPVSNQFPTIKNVPYKIAIIGEAPGADEVREGKPFVGASGRFLSQLLSKAGILRDACFIGNVCQHRPPANDITKFSREGPQITSGLAQLQSDLDTFQPNICLLLGKTALWAAKDLDGISDWRGSLFLGSRPPFLGRKCLPAYHPAACLRQYDWTPLLMFDLRKALTEATSPLLTLPERSLIIDLSVDQILREIDQIETDRIPISPDIEGYWNAMSCISLAKRPDYSFIIPFTDLLGNSIWSLDEEVLIWRALARVMANPSVPKITQNGLYDRFVLQYGYQCVIRGRQDDTMLKFWELYCELEKSLGFQCSILTQEPFYKFERKIGDKSTHFRYCCRDSAVTYEINTKLDKWLDPAARRHYELNISLLNPILYMELRGIRYDSTAAKLRLTQITTQINELQSDLNDTAGCGIPPNQPTDSLLSLVQSKICYKRDPNQPKKGHEEEYSRVKTLLTQKELTKAGRGDIANVCDTGLNIKGAKFKKFLYETLSLPKQHHPLTHELTTNYEALLRLSKSSSHPSLQLALDIGELRTRAQMLGIDADPDGRVRAGYNIVGTETGRITCYTSPTGSGYNLQTIPAENQLKPLDHPLRSGMRDLFLSDEGYYLFQCDLSGADGWTIGAQMATLGDPTMLEDLKAGIKPARVVCYMLRHGADGLKGKTRPEIKELISEVKKDDWDYFASKVGIWGVCYLMGPRLLANVIFTQSEGKVNMSEKETKVFRQLVFTRYRVDSIWHPHMTRFLSRQPYPPKLTAASGHTRKFFGRSQEVLGQALAHEPQANTTYATNLAAYKLWTDPENRINKPTPSSGLHSTGLSQSGTLLRIEPLHQVHDALLGQFRKEETEWAVAKIKSYFNNEIVIAGQKIVIPFEGAYGTNWALDDKSKIGTI